jgi:hypothetical protein
MPCYPLNELADMHLMYSRANENVQRAARTCQKAFPHRRHSNRNTLSAIDRRLRGSWKFKPFSVNCLKQRSFQTPDVENYAAKENPGDSIRQTPTELNFAQGTVWRAA